MHYDAIAPCPTCGDNRCGNCKTVCAACGVKGCKQCIPFDKRWEAHLCDDEQCAQEYANKYWQETME